jgi:hypothetical protein
LLPEKGIVCLPPSRSSKLITALGPPPGPAIEDAVDIAATRDSLCAARRDGAVVCWDLTPSDDPPPAERMRPVAGVTGTLALVASQYTMCALRGGNLAACWGGGIVTTQGGLRDAMVGGLHDFAAVGPVTDLAFLGWPHDNDCAVRVDGTTVCWPQPFIKFEERPKPRTVEGKTIDVPPAMRLESTKIDEAHCVLTRERDVYCWGNVTMGRLGVGRAPEQLTPGAIEGVTGVRDLVASDQRACARTSRGLWCWGGGTTPHEVKVEGLDRLLSGMCASLRGELFCYAGVLTEPLPESGLRDVVQLAPGAQGSHLLSYSALHKDGTVSRVDWSREGDTWSLVRVGRMKGLDGVSGAPRGTSGTPSPPRRGRARRTGPRRDRPALSRPTSRGASGRRATSDRSSSRPRGRRPSRRGRGARRRGSGCDRRSRPGGSTRATLRNRSRSRSSPAHRPSRLRAPTTSSPRARRRARSRARR